jgi:hypothetical protein
MVSRSPTFTLRFEKYRNPLRHKHFFGVNVRMISRWQAEYPEFFQVLITWEFPRLCRGGSQSLTYPGV